MSSNHQTAALNVSASANTKINSSFLPSIYFILNRFGHQPSTGSILSNSITIPILSSFHFPSFFLCFFRIWANSPAVPPRLKHDVTDYTHIPAFAGPSRAIERTTERLIYALTARLSSIHFDFSRVCTIIVSLPSCLLAKDIKIIRK